VQGVQWMKVALAEHEAAWAEEFALAKKQICGIWGANVLDVQHVGSTAINCICAKPILDIAVVLQDYNGMDIAAMQRAGYRYMGPRNAQDTRRLFILYVEKDGCDEVALQHVHCYPPGDGDFDALIRFRDYLSVHPQEAKRYDAIKRALAQEFAQDRFAYSEGKRAFIEEILRKTAEESR